MNHEAGRNALNDAVADSRRRLLAENPAEFWREVAGRLHGRARHREALQAFATARSLDGRVESVEGFDWIRLGWPERARPIFEQALSRDPRDEEAAAGLALLRRCDEGVRGAVETFRGTSRPDRPGESGAERGPATPECSGESVAGFLRGEPIGLSTHLLQCPACRRDAVERWELASSGGSQRSLALTLRLHDAALRAGEGRPVIFPDGSRARIAYDAAVPRSLVIDRVEPLSGFEATGFSLVRGGSALPAERRGEGWSVGLPGDGEPADAHLALRISLRATGREEPLRLVEIPCTLRVAGEGAAEIRTLGGETFLVVASALPIAPDRFWRQGEGTWIAGDASKRGLFRIRMGAGGHRIDGSFPPGETLSLEFGSEPFPDAAREREALRAALEELGEPEALEALDAAARGTAAVAERIRWREVALDGTAMERCFAAGKPFRTRLPDLGDLEAVRAQGVVSVALSLDAAAGRPIVLVLGARWVVLDRPNAGRAERSGLDPRWFAGQRIAIRDRARAAPAAGEGSEAQAFVEESIRAPRAVRTGDEAGLEFALEATKGGGRLGTLFLVEGLRSEPGAVSEAEFRFGEAVGRAPLEPDARGLYRLALPEAAARARRETTIEARWRGVVLRGFTEGGVLHLEFPAFELPAKAELEIFETGG